MGLDHNLLAQLLVVLVGASAFIFILEGFGYSFLQLIRWVLRKAWPDNLGFSLRLFIGGLFYSLVFFGLGAVGLLTKSSVIWVSLALPILALLVGRRWRELTRAKLAAAYARDKYIFWGGLALLLFSFVMWFRPATTFDAMWYHLTIPKLFLQNHSIANQGVLVLYSLQPTLNYFWDLWSLALVNSTAVASIMINATQAFLLFFSLIFATKIGRKLWGWGRFHQLAAPLLLGGTYVGLTQFGSGGNDTAGLAYALVAALYVFYILRGQAISWFQFIIGVLLVVALASVKIFFAIFALFILAYLLVGAWPKLPEANRNRRLFRLGLILAVIFIVTYLPWVIRSYAATGRPLDPLGSPGFNQEVYLNEGGGSALNHWTSYIFDRFYGSIWPIMTFVYSPLVLIGSLSILHKKIRLAAGNLWLVAFLGLWVVYFADIALQWRYFLPSAVILSFLGLATLIYALKEFDLFGRLLVWSLLIVFLLTAGARAVLTPTDKTNDPSINRNIYVRHFAGSDSYLRAKLVDIVHDYNQDASPAGLNPNERILIGNVYWHDILAVGIHNMAYINNPILEPSVNKSDFAHISSAGNVVSLMQSHHIRFMLAREDVNDVCRTWGASDYNHCSDLLVPVLKDPHWNVTWYKLKAS